MRPNQKCDCGECRRCKHRIYMRDWYHRPENRERQRERNHSRPPGAADNGASQRWRARNREKVLAQRKARYALSRGYIERRGCEVCGDWAEMHHDDYSKPLEVRWFCRRHHHDHHRKDD